MIDLSKVTEDQVFKECNKVITYQVVKSEVDLTSLKDMLNSLESMKPPSDKEVLSMAKRGLVHPYYEPRRIIEIDGLRSKIEEVEEL